ncbi:hypothetical protein PG991_008991 [Apiospora marii]|uniref:Uncharacterized protein n=1 Tax=Apiospora marii TaxID=335849 RepID=A0ABR1RJQ2_9PEZI
MKNTASRSSLLAVALLETYERCDELPEADHANRAVTMVDSCGSIWKPLAESNTSFVTAPVEQRHAQQYPVADFGFSLHHCCRRGILLAYPSSTHVVLQIFDRLTRIDQQGEDTWWGKHAIQFASETTVGNMKGPWGNAVMFEINRMRLSRPFIRFFFHGKTG